MCSYENNVQLKNNVKIITRIISIINKPKEEVIYYYQIGPFDPNLKA